MKTAVSLYEFMPYGAPELIESRQRHLARALVLTSFSSLVLSVSIGALLSHIPVRPEDLRVQVAILDPYVVTPPPLVPRAPSTPQIPIRRTTSHPAVPVPVPETVEPHEVAPPTGPAIGSDTGTDRASDRSDVVTRTDNQTPPPPDTNVYVEELPSVVKEVKPDYPQIARDFGIEGLVLVRVLVGTNGRVLDVRLSEKQQVPMLNDAALAAARKWVFTPGLANGRPVSCWTAIPFRFRLH